VNGSSAAAAAVAGAAALLAQARPSLDANALKALLVGSARPLEDEPPIAQGAGFVDIGAAAAAEIAVTPAAVVLDLLPGRRTARQTLVVRNVSVRPVMAEVRVRSTTDVVVTASPSRLRLRPGASVEVRLVARPRRAGARGGAVGSIRVVPDTGVTQRAFWSMPIGAVDQALLASMTFVVGGEQGKREGPPAFKPSDSAPAVLSLQAGQVIETSGRLELEPIARLDIRLVTHDRDDLGLLARLRDLLPGRYAFGLTGRGPGGNVLQKGDYELHVAAFPTLPGRPTRRTIKFNIR
jgi:hypothetical protein